MLSTKSKQTSGTKNLNLKIGVGIDHFNKKLGNNTLQHAWTTKPDDYFISTSQ